MYTRQEASQLRQEFWTTFGQYMSPILSAEGEKVNWINYKTGEKHIHFKMDAANRSASIGIVVSHPDPDIQQLYFEQFVQLRAALHASLGEEWKWEMLEYDETGKLASRIYTTLDETSVLNKSHWPALISFFKPRMIALDEFWSNARYAFELLR
ncbi:DUF4268 domain-containing protein [Aridibaculum aurantiacum]|uniref:DUF4268 domain-containing protein n=1 Tax=Aridibaculum aurantiacum TaxID=2810307 RepID=UPI001A976D88|nr:DUF4268 domain-containing protein [Aridibaculum aurantiacum]